MKLKEETPWAKQVLVPSLTVDPKPARSLLVSEAFGWYSRRHQGVAMVIKTENVHYAGFRTCYPNIYSFLLLFSPSVMSSSS